MSDGYSRNKAQAIAELMNNAKFPYEKAIEVFCKNRFFAPLYSVFANLANIAIAAAENLKRIALNIKKIGDSNAE